MPKTSEKTKVGKDGKQVQAQFVNFDFDKDTREQFKRWLHEHAADFTDYIERLLDDGYNLSIKFDAYNDCISAFISPQARDNPLHGWILSGRGSTAFSAAMGAMYRHYVIFDGVWPIEDIRRNGLDDD